MAGEVVVARPATRAERLVRWCRRRPAQAGLTVVVCALAACLVGGLGTAAWMLDQARDRALDHLQAAQQARDQAEGNARRAVHAEYEARLAEAQAVRFSGSAGRRRESLAAIQRAVRLLPDLNLDGDPRHALRQEAYEALKLVDLQPVATWQVPGGLPLGPIGVDHDRDRYAWADPATSRLSIHRCSDSQRQRILTLPQEVERIADIQFSADGRYLAARCARPDGTVEVPVWSVDDPHPRIRVAAMPGQATAFDFSPDSQWLAVALPAGSVGLYATPDFRLVRTLEDKVAAWTVRFDSSSTRLASYRVGRIDIATVDTGQVLQTISCPSFVAQLDFSSDGQLLAAACEDKLVRTWTLPGGRLMGSLAGHDTAVSQVRFQPQGHFLASAGRSGTTLLWSLRGDPQAVLRIPLPLTSFSRDGQLLGLGGTWQRILDVDHQSVAIPLLPGSRSSAAERLSVDHTGQVLAVSSGKQLALVDLAAARVTASMVTTDTYPQFDPPGKALLAATNHGLYRSPARWEGDNALRRFTCGESQQLTSATSGYVVASRDGQRLAWADRYFQPRVMVYDESTQSARQLLPHHEGARWLSLSASGRWLVTGAWQRNDVCVWDVTTGTLVTRLKTASARVAFHPDETQLAVNEGHQWTVYGTRDWVPVAPATQRSPTADPGPLAYSEDGRLLALTGRTAPHRVAGHDELGEAADNRSTR